MLQEADASAPAGGHRSPSSDSRPPRPARGTRRSPPGQTNTNTQAHRQSTHKQNAHTSKQSSKQAHANTSTQSSKQASKQASKQTHTHTHTHKPSTRTCTRTRAAEDANAHGHTNAHSALWSHTFNCKEQPRKRLGPSSQIRGFHSPLVKDNRTALASQA